MTENFTLNLLAGGYATCGPAWQQRNPAFDRCYKFYLLDEGKAAVSDSLGRHDLRPGFLYFISGYRLSAQECPRGMRVHWLHFTPASYFIHRYLASAPCVHAWPVGELPWAATVMKSVAEVFDNPTSTDVSQLKLSRQAPLATLCRLEAMAMTLVADLLEIHARPAKAEGPDLARLREAIRQMDAQFLNPPPLADLAALVGMSAIGFHRAFRKVFGTTPHHYMTAKRMERARRLLTEPLATVKDVANRCGFTDPLYFSRVFHQHFGMRPSAVRDDLKPSP